MDADQGDKWLKSASPKDQCEHVVRWFHANFDDPVNSLPLDDEHETGFGWIYGGPHDAREQILEEFEGVVPESVLEDAVESVELEGVWWVSHAEMEAADQEARWESLEAVRSNAHPRATLEDALRDVERLVDRHEDRYLRQLALVGVIAALEALLLDFFVGQVTSDDELLRRVVETDKAFGSQKLEQSTIIQRSGGLAEAATKYFAHVAWHRLEHVVPLYTRTFRIRFDKEDLDVLGAAITKRHDIVHREGKSKDGTPTSVSSNEVQRVIKSVCSVVDRSVSDGNDKENF